MSILGLARDARVSALGRRASTARSAAFPRQPNAIAPTQINARQVPDVSTDYRAMRIAKLCRCCPAASGCFRLRCGPCNEPRHTSSAIATTCDELRSARGAFRTAHCNSTTKHERLWRRLRRDCASSAGGYVVRTRTNTFRFRSRQPNPASVTLIKEIPN